MARLKRVTYKQFREVEYELCQAHFKKYITMKEWKEAILELDLIGRYHCEGLMRL